MDRHLEKPPGSPARDVGPPAQPDPMYPDPSASAEVYVWKIPPGGQPAGAPVTTGDRANMLRQLGPIAAGVKINVHPRESGKLLRTVENITLGVSWAGGVTGTFFGAAATHLPSAGTITLIVLEILIPPIFFRGRRRKDVESSRPLQDEGLT